MAKLNLNRISMPRQDPIERGKNFNEVALGYSGEQAIEEASRCIQCPKRPCVDGCPVNVDIPEFITALREGNMPEAVRALKGKNSLPGICGRVCPQETQCEEVCTLNKKGAPVAIGRLERYVADWERDHPEAVEADVCNGYVSIEKAKEGYGVVIDPASLKVDWIETEKVRGEMK